MRVVRTDRHNVLLPLNATEQKYTECLSAHQSDPEVCMRQYETFFACADQILQRYGRLSL